VGRFERTLTKLSGGIKDPEISGKVLGLYALICCGGLCLMVYKVLGEQEVGGAVAPVLWVLMLLLTLPWLFAAPFLLWGTRRPLRGFFTDLRVWFLTAVGVVGLVIGDLAGADASPARFFVHLGVGLASAGLMIVILDLALQIRFTKLEEVEKRGWQGDTKNIKGLDWQYVWFREMSPLERWHYCLSLTIGGVGLLVALMILATSGHYYASGLLILAWVLPLHYYEVVQLRSLFLEKKKHLFELQAARQMQMSLMPKEDPRPEGLDIVGLSLPAEEVGGDLYDFFEAGTTDGSVGIVVADVSGKGMKGAIATVLVSGMLRSEYRRSGKPSEILDCLNRALEGSLESHGFVAMQILTVAPRQKVAHYANAGQVPPLLRRKGNIQYLGEGALPLGIAGFACYEDVTVVLEGGDILLLLSDGIVEAMNEEHVLFGFERLEAAVLALAQELPARAMADSFLAQVRAFAGKAKQHDDMTLVVVKVV
jgi:sulfur transfer complex TusBCD TusB component (DsrH family)